MIVAQKPAQSLAAPHWPLAVPIRRPRKQQDITLPLVIPLGMEMLDIVAQRPPQGALAEEDHRGHANDQLLDLSLDPRSARASTRLRAIEFAGDKLAIPAQASMRAQSITAPPAPTLGEGVVHCLRHRYADLA
jgi:hypothetical protein